MGIQHHRAAAVKRVRSDGFHAGGKVNIDQILAVCESAAADGHTAFGDQNGLAGSALKGFIADDGQIAGQAQNLEIVQRGNREIVRMML